MKATIVVYLWTGQVFEYDVTGDDAVSRAREHAQQIISKGYRSIQKKGGDLTHYPPHTIDKVKIKSEENQSNYFDRVSAT